MTHKFLLGSIIALFAWSGIAQAQATLGSPITPDKTIYIGRSLDCGTENINSEEAQIQARLAAIRYLSTIDCHINPEVEIGLVSALRTDRAECVRYEAAVALGNGRGLTLTMLDALNMTALGVELDGNPAETSERVRIAARISLYRCACRGLCLPPEPPSVPTSYAAPALAPASQQERELAQTISIAAKATSAKAPRPVYHFLLGLIGCDRPRDDRENVDPRLRGLVLLGTETTVAIPTTPAFSAYPQLPYNDR